MCYINPTRGVRDSGGDNGGSPILLFYPNTSTGKRFAIGSVNQVNITQILLMFLGSPERISVSVRHP